jgi:myo-inositol-1(or 4)-monophosphatase
MQAMRRTGSAALDMCWTACGRFDGYFEYKLGPWDFAAGSLIVTEAGGICSTREGTTFEISSTGIICSNELINMEFTRLVSWSDAPETLSLNS